jgi:hypothetical protein
MARKQTRRTVSLNRSDYEAAKEEAARRGMSIAGLVETGLAAIGVPMVAHTQQTPAMVQKSVTRRAEGAERRQAAKRFPSRERQLLGDQVADACGFQ